MASNNVTLSTNFNVAPYYDDFDETKNFHRILFRPGLAVQARELTQMQSIMQNQIDRFASHIFQEGSTVRGLEMFYDVDYNFIKLRDRSSAAVTVTVANFSNAIIKGATSGVLAKVVNVYDGSEADQPNFKTLYVKYIAANNTTGYRYFANNEIINTISGTYSANTIPATFGTHITGATGRGSAAIFQSGVVYAKDHFIRVPAQTVIVSKYNNLGSVRVGFDVRETIVTEVTDGTLLDPASGSYNYAAPGAARLKLEAPINAYSLTATVSNTFVELMQVKEGIVQSLTNHTQYSQIRDYMAKRTYDESGDYIVNGFAVSVVEHLKSGNNGGYYTSAQGGDVNKLLVSVDPGKAYVKGYDVDRIVTISSPVDKGIDYDYVSDGNTLADYGNYVIVNNVTGNWDVNGQGIVGLRSKNANTLGNSTVGSGVDKLTTNFLGSQIGTARVRNIEYYTGTPGTAGGQYKMYLTNINMTPGYSFTNVKSIAYNPAPASGALGKANILGTTESIANATLTDPSYDIAVFRTPTKATRNLKNSSDVYNNDYWFIKSYDSASFLTSGICTLVTGDTSEYFPGTSTVALSTSAARDNFYVVCTGSSNTSTYAETLTTTSGSNTVTASATIDTKLSAGDIINIHTGGGDYVVSAVSGSTITLAKNATASGGTKAFHKRFYAGQVIDMAGKGKSGSTRTITPSGTPLTTATLDLKEGALTSALSVSIVARVKKSDTAGETKTVLRNRYVCINVNNGGGTSYVANTTGPWPLGVSDGFKLVSVRKKNGSNFTTGTEGTDVTTHFSLDSGMTDNYYGHAKLVKNSGSNLSIVANDRLLVKFDYFTHGSTGRGYFSVDSYPVDDTNAATDTSKIYTYQIPVYNSPTSGITYNLRDCIDNRPRMTDTAANTASVTSVSINPKTANTWSIPSSGLHFPPSGESFTSDASYYQPRVDIVSLTTKGALDITRGVSSNKPVPPTVSDDSMPIATLFVAPYPSIPEQLARRVGRPDLGNSIRRINNRRYTMKDIGQIAQRIDRLEYYTSLNLLEKSARDLLIQDTSGNNRFKNGMLIDAFINHAIGNVTDLDYKIAIDPVSGNMRPRFTIDEIPLVYTSSSSNVVRSNVTVAGVAKDQRITLSSTPSAAAFNVGDTVTSGAVTATIRNKVGTRIYVENSSANFTAAASITSGGQTLTISAVKAMTTVDNLVTLPYSHKVLVNQPYATTTRNVAGGAYRYKGTVTLTPDSDYWCDTVEAPDPTNITLDMNTDAWKYLASTWPATWNSPITTFVGQPVVSSTTTAGGQYTVGDASGTQFRVYQDYNTTTTTTRQTQTTQTGNQTGVAINTNVQSFGNVVRDTSVVAWMRSKMIFFVIQGMKPSSRLFSFFDEINVSSYITPLTSTEYANGLKDSNGNVVKPTALEGADLVTGTDGTAYGVFRLPNDPNMRFRTGTKRIRFVDNPTNSTAFGQYTTSAEAQYTAEGLSSNVQALTLTTKSVSITQTALSKTTHGSTSTSQTSSSTELIDFYQIPAPPSDSTDPLAQTFLVTAQKTAKIGTTGMYLTKFDLYFATKDNTQPVVVELREVDPLSGGITNRTLPYARAIISADDINASTDATKATPVYFPAPVYLSDETEYAIVIEPGGGSPNFTVWTAVLAGEDISNTSTKGSRVSTQPASGFLFMSGNNRQYQPIQDEDLKFTAYYAEFDTSSTGTLVVKNPNMDYVEIANTTGALNRAGEVIHGQTRLVGTFAPGNGLRGNVATSNSFVQGMTSGATGTIVSISTNHVVVRDVSIENKFVTGEQVRFRLGQSATTSPISGNGSVTSSTYPVGRIYYYNAIDYANTRIIIANTSYVASGTAFANNRYFLNNMYIKGQSNGYSARITNYVPVAMDNVNLITNLIVPSNNDVQAYAKMSTSASTRDTSYFKININGETEFTSPRYRLSRSVESNTAASSATLASNRSVEIKYELNGYNKVASPAIDLSRLSLYSAHNLISTNAAITVTEDYVKSGGLAQSRYITRTVTLTDGQDAEDLRVYLTAYKPSGSNIFVYYKILHADDSDTFGDARWIPMTLDTGQGFTSDIAYSSSENRNDFLELTYKIPAYAATTGSPYLFGANNSTGVVEYRNTAKVRFSSFKYFAIKIVLTNQNSSNPPRVKDLRAIALQI